MRPSTHRFFVAMAMVASVCCGGAGQAEDGPGAPAAGAGKAGQAGQAGKAAGGDEGSARNDNASPEQAPAGAEPIPAAKTEEPAHPYTVQILDVRGHAPLPDEPRLDVWAAMDGLGGDRANGEVHKLAVLVDGNAERADLVAYLMPELYAALSEHEDKEQTPTLWIDERLPSETATKILYTAARAGFVSYHFVVGKPGAREIVTVEPPRFGGPTGKPSGAPHADLNLAWTEAGVLAGVKARHSDRELFIGGPRIPLAIAGVSCLFPGGPRVDPVAYNEILTALCEASGGKKFAVQVRLGEHQQFGDVLWALAVDRRPDECRLSAIVEAGAEDEVSCEGALPIGPALEALAGG